MPTVNERCIKELELAGFFNKDSDYEGGIGESVKELLEVFAKQGHSGFSANRTADIFHQLIKGGTILPLKGTPDEWMEPMDGVYQNKRNFSVFAESDTGKNAFLSGGKIFIDKNGVTYTGNKSRVPIKFPCYPKPILVHDNLLGKIKAFFRNLKNCFHTKVT